MPSNAQPANSHEIQDLLQNDWGHSLRDVSRPLSQNKNLLRWVEKMADLTKPAAIHWVTGSQQEYDALCEQMVSNGTFTRLNQELWPGCFLARSDPSDVA